MPDRLKELVARKPRLHELVQLLSAEPTRTSDLSDGEPKPLHDGRILGVQRREVRDDAGHHVALALVANACADELSTQAHNRARVEGRHARDAQRAIELALSGAAAAEERLKRNERALLKSCELHCGRRGRRANASDRRCGCDRSACDNAKHRPSAAEDAREHRRRRSRRALGARKLGELATERTLTRGATGPCGALERRKRVGRASGARTARANAILCDAHAIERSGHTTRGCGRAVEELHHPLEAVRHWSLALKRPANRVQKFSGKQPPDVFFVGVYPRSGEPLCSGA
ncbi:MAG: hypothetical protein JNK05_34935 [Myxococcales bacterium]|nr:hypothetical protein [Myxococcales bacterium]